MKTVQLHPYFLVATSCADVRSIIDYLKVPIDEDKFEKEKDAPYFPPEYMSSIHLHDVLSERTNSAAPSSAGALERDSAPKPVATPGSTSLAGVSTTELTARAFSLTDQNEGGVNKVTEDATKLAPADDRSPNSLVITGHYNSSILMRSLRAEKPHQPAVLYIWDLDDTLVASGVSGVRQNLVFRESELVGLFRSAGANARHLLLSQGSIDDVLEEPSGRLRCIRSFLEHSAATQNGRSRSARRGVGLGGSSKSSSASERIKEKSSLADWLRCGSGRQVKEPPSPLSSTASDCSAVVREGISRGSSEEQDLRNFTPGTVVVRLATIRDRSETPQDGAFLTDPFASPTCSRTSEGQLDEKMEDTGRWLILRPEVWGITLAPLSTFFPPSRHTASVNGRLYRKMDIVWSLAMSGAWDSVFFIDNNLSEVAAVRYGLQMTDVLELRSQRKLYRFFQADYLLLATSAKLREMEKRYNRDVTQPPRSADPFPTATRNRRPHAQDENGTPSRVDHTVSKTASTSNGMCKKNGEAIEGCDEVRLQSEQSKTSMTGNRGGKIQNAASTGAATASINTTEDDRLTVNSITERISMTSSSMEPPSQSKRRLAAVQKSGEDADGVILASLLLQSQQQNDCAEDDPTQFTNVSLSTTALPRGSSVNDVSLVVVNLHMPSKAYYAALTTSRTNSSGQRSLPRTYSPLHRYVGQPVFVGDRSCTDEQYKAIITYFQESESTLFQMIEEEIRLNGFVNVESKHRWAPQVRLVHAALPTRPTAVPHLLELYNPFLKEVEERLLTALQRTGGTSASCILHGEAQRLYFVLQRVLPFIDPYLTGDLGRAFFDIYSTDGNIPRSLAEQLKKALSKTRARLQDADRRKKK